MQNVIMEITYLLHLKIKNEQFVSKCGTDLCALNKIFT